MPGFSLRNIAYLSENGQTVRIQPRSGSLPALEFRADTEGTISAVSITSPSGSTEGYNLDKVRWATSPDPNPTYIKNTRYGPVARFRAGGPKTTLTALVPSEDGEKKFTVVVEHGTVNVVQDLFKQPMTRGDETLKIETGFWFGEAKTQLPTRLVRTMSPGVPSERTVIVEKLVDYPANKGVPLSESILFPSSVAKGTTGVGYEFVWECDVAPGQVVHSHALPVWVLGDDPSCKPPTLASVPASSSLTYPSIFQRKATDTPAITPTTGQTYQGYLDRWQAVAKVNNPTGPWLSFNNYYGNIYFVDLDDPTVPRYRISHWDIQGWGYDLAGWYGTDTTVSPNRTKVAVDVPIPNNAMSSRGTDRSLCIVGMRKGKVETIWELWVALKRGNGQWEAASIAKTTPDDQWLHPTGYTVASAGISALAYALRVCEAKDAVDYVRAERAAGRIPSEDVIAQKVPHSLSFNLPDPLAWVFSWPASHTDGSDNNQYTPAEGQKIYLKSTFDVAAQNYPPLTHVIGVIGKRYGWLVTDKTAWSTTMIVEGDDAYGEHNAIWNTILTGNESWSLNFPYDQYVIGRRYANKAEWDKDTTTNPSTGGSGEQAVVNASGLPFKLGVFGHNVDRAQRFATKMGRALDMVTVAPQRNSDGWHNTRSGSQGMLDSTWWLTQHPSSIKELDVAVPLWQAAAGETLDKAATGTYNTYWEQFGKLVHDAKPGSTVRIGWEANLQDWPHACRVGDEAKWKAAAQHANASVKKGGPSLKMCFNPNAGAPSSGYADPVDFYPGDQYIDIIGLDMYDWWPPYTTDANWASHRDGTGGLKFWLDFARAHGKKFMFPEIGLANGPESGSTNYGHDNPKFFAYVVPYLKDYKDIMYAFCYFDETEPYIANSIADGQVPNGGAELKKQLDLAATW